VVSVNSEFTARARVSFAEDESAHSSGSFADFYSALFLASPASVRVLQKFPDIANSREDSLIKRSIFFLTRLLHLRYSVSLSAES
jgi:hypothetical protein